MVVAIVKSIRIGVRGPLFFPNVCIFVVKNLSVGQCDQIINAVQLIKAILAQTGNDGVAQSFVCEVR